MTKDVRDYPTNLYGLLDIGLDDLREVDRETLVDDGD
jgi:hypothetical protein